MMTIAMTPEAQQLLDRYLTRARISLKGTSVETDEIERDVRAHIEEALTDCDDPILAPELDEVLGRLGSPDQWVPEDEVSSWRRMMNRFSTGTEDWRLAYVCFGLTILGFATFPFGGFILVFGAYILARATVALMNERGENLGVRRWLVYPPLVFFSLAVVVLVLTGPVAAFAGGYFDSVEDDVGFANYLTSGMKGSPIAIGIAFTFGAAGIWFLFVSFVSAVLINPLRALLVPIADGLRRGHMLWLGLAGFFMLGVCATMLLFV